MAVKRNTLSLVLIAALVGCAVLGIRVKDLHKETAELHALINFQRNELLEKQAQLDLAKSNLEQERDALWQTRNDRSELRAELQPKEKPPTLMPLDGDDSHKSSPQSSEINNMKQNMMKGILKKQYEQVFKALSLDAERQDKMLDYLARRNEAQLAFSMLLISDLSTDDLLNKQEILYSPLKDELKNILQNYEAERFITEEQNARRQTMKNTYQAQMAQLNLSSDTREAALRAIEEVIDKIDQGPMLGQFTQENLTSLRARYGNNKSREAGMINASIEEMKKNIEPVLKAAEKYLPKDEFNKFKASQEQPIKMMHNNLQHLTS